MNRGKERVGMNRGRKLKLKKWERFENPKKRQKERFLE
jgi:hypothetical protein